MDHVVQVDGQGVAFGLGADQRWHEGAIGRVFFMLVEHGHDVANRLLVPLSQQRAHAAIPIGRVARHALAAKHEFAASQCRGVRGTSTRVAGRRLAPGFAFAATHPDRIGEIALVVEPIDQLLSETLLLIGIKGVF